MMNDHLWHCNDYHLRPNVVVCFQMINGSQSQQQQLHKVEHPKNARLCRVILFFCMMLLHLLLVEKQKEWKPLSISFLTYKRTICQDNLAHKSDDLIYMFKCNWNCSLSYLVLSGSVWSGKRVLPKDGSPTSFAKRRTPSWQEWAMCILSKHQHQFNWKIEAQFLITFNPGLSTLRLFSALQLLDQP